MVIVKLRREGEARTPRLRATVRMVARLVFVLGLVALSAALSTFWRIHSSNASEDRALFAQQQPPHRGQRIIVFSPHCDDEALGAGGYIAAAVRAGADVRVVMVTNGDGFELAAALHYKEIRMTPALLRSFACDRQTEAIKADGALGVKPEQMVFLGFPDRGLAELWRSHWSPENLYYSQYTHTNHNPYTRSLHPGEPYCGQRLLADIEEELIEFKPDVVLSTHPNDDHPDHWATGNFVRAAMADLKRQGVASIRNVPCVMFIVHHGDWPVPQGYNPTVRLAPPFGLARTDTRWSELSLPHEDERAKAKSIHLYTSQTAVLGRFMDSFIRRTECFGSLPATYLDAAMPPDPDSRVLLQSGPVGDTLLRSMERGANIQQIDAAREGDFVCIRVKVGARMSPQIAYSLYLQTIQPGGAAIEQWHATVHGARVDTDIPGGHAWTAGPYLEVHIPVTQFRSRPDWFISADTQSSYMQLDHAGWRELHVSVSNNSLGA